ncbi:carboxypeptidase Taq [Alkalispirochaeta americana]|uniref:Metal-dependent carboxypeptidase n=1 Tax=Alkalispirochaeta americana TaxID=159291 RepID=A0A1N6VBC1_9SPIO|nr:carboxypeptidase M32 [Alkalispirochaeta americana]SIQ75019.1 carboxypeptidase Taq [Alkalispirochaeta americana]
MIGETNSPCARAGSPGDPLEELKALDREARLLEHSGAVLSWDQEVYMPPAAVEERADQLALLQSLAHQRDSSPRVGELLDLLQAESSLQEGVEGFFLREKRRSYERSCRVPERLVRDLAQTASRGQNAWVAARKANDYDQFKPWLERLIELNRELADHLGYRETPYDALLDQYEPYTSTAEVAEVFGTLKEGLIPLVQKIASRPLADHSFLRHSFPVEGQKQLSQEVMLALGYDLDQGRLDCSAHPFTTTLGSRDVRITTRFNEKLVESGLFSTIHETGHALYELGVGEDLAGTLLAEGTSLGIHESQSRMWENMIGRSRAFWSHWLPRMAEIFPDQLEGVSLERFYRGINRVEPSLIRVEADEVTYSLHVILRFELEQALISGDLPVDDLPGAWNQGMKELLGVVPRDYSSGVLQDVHWSMGAFGYFPTYALGNLYAAQFLKALERDLPALWEGIARGEYAPILGWLRQKVHRHGKCRSAGELVREITGGPLDSSVFLEYLWGKYDEEQGR